MSQRGRRRRRRTYTLQVLWIVVAILATVGLIIGYKLGVKENDTDLNSVVNAAEHPTQIVVENTATPVPTLEPTTEPTVTPTVTPIPTATPTPEPTPQGPYQVYEGDKQDETQNGEVVTPTGEAEKPTEEKPEKTQKMIALTFDDGPYPPVTERILKLLKDNDSHATFFVMGNRMDTYPDTVAQAFEDGNQIGNHTYSHKDLSKLNASDIAYEVEHSNELINKNAAVGDAYLRPPYGAKNDTVRSAVKVPMICWSVDTLDWKSKDKDAIYKEIMDNVKDGDILLMHDLYPTTADAMEKVIPELIRQGYKLVTVQELLEANGITPEGGTVYYNAR